MEVSPEQKKRDDQHLRRQAARQYVDSIMGRLSCVNCGFKDRRALDFHHDQRAMMVHGPKKKTVASLVSEGADIRAIRQEIKKCIVLCSNCHRIHHAKERERSRR